jgi:hypothetical protein
MAWYSDGTYRRMYPEPTELWCTQLNKPSQTYFPLFLPPQAPGGTTGAAPTPLAS